MAQEQHQNIIISFWKNHVLNVANDANDGFAIKLQMHEK